MRPKGIVWVASYPKSGNTWMRVFLYHLIRLVGGHQGDSDGLADLRRIGGSESGRLDLFERFLGKPPAAATVEEIAAVRPAVQGAIAAEADGLVVTKTHNAFGTIFGAPTIDMKPTAGAIYVIRNPLDVAVSLAAHFDIPIDEAVDRMCLDNCMASGDGRGVYEFWGSWSQNVESWTGNPHPSIMPVRYEDMLSMPKAVFRAAADFIAQRPSEEQLATAIRLSSFDRLRNAERKGGFQETIREGQQFFRIGRAGTWQKALTENQIGRIVGKHHLHMRRAGYLTGDLVHYAPAGQQ